MREILFRGQTRRLGEKVWMNGEKVPSNWAYGGICQGKGAFSIIYGSMDSELESPTEKHVIYTDTIGQYTGLTDKNGKKIFDGDIIKQTFHLNGFERDVLSVIEYGISYAYSNVCGVCERFSDGSGIAMLSVGDQTGVVFCEVIGNIHDNPELLIGGKKE